MGKVGFEPGREDSGSYELPKACGIGRREETICAKAQNGSKTNYLSDKSPLVPVVVSLSPSRIVFLNKIFSYHSMSSSGFPCSR